MALLVVNAVVPLPAPGKEAPPSTPGSTKFFGRRHSSGHSTAFSRVRLIRGVVGPAWSGSFMEDASNCSSNQSSKFGAMLKLLATVPARAKEPLGVAAAISSWNLHRSRRAVDERPSPGSRRASWSAYPEPLESDMQASS